MSQKYLEYALVDGFIHNWLVAGPHSGDDKLLEFDRSKYPVERDRLQIGDFQYIWKYQRCEEDHRTNFTTIHPLPNTQHGWAYAILQASEEIEASLTVQASGAIRIWLNDTAVFTSDGPSGAIHSSIPVKLQESNHLLVKIAGSGIGATSAHFSIHLDLPAAAPTAIKILIPTRAKFPNRFQALEKLLEFAYLENIVHCRGDHFNLRWMEEVKDESFVAFSVQDAQEHIYVNGKYAVDAANPQDIGQTYRLHERPYWVALSAPGREYWEQDLRYTRRIPIHILDTEYSAKPYGSPLQRRQEALAAAAKFENLFGTLARLELGRWGEIHPETIQQALGAIQRQEWQVEENLLGTWMILHTYMDHPSFPEQLRPLLKQTLIDYPYHRVTNPASAACTILNLAVEVLAGQLFPDEVFSASGKTGAWHRLHGEQQAQAWIIERGEVGLWPWNADPEWPGILLALAQIATHAESMDLTDLAAVLLDKMLFLLAVNSFKGSFAASQGRASAASLKSSQLEATSGINRLLWGMGVFNHFIAGVVGLACSEYEYPAFFQQIASQLPENFLHREQIATSREENAQRVHLVTYKTPDFQLSSAQDFQAGALGGIEHLWQATFGPEAIVFANHPACASEDPAFNPGFWSGNACRPRLAQVNDLLIAIHNSPEGVGLDFTHAYFPLPAFDDFFFTDQWAFLKKGDGYLALAAARGTQFTRQGANAYRELRSPGRQNTWIAQLGRAKQDGSFADFRQKVMACSLAWLPLGAKIETIRGESVQFEWEGSLLVSGQSLALHAERHIDNPYCRTDFPAEQLEITFGETAMRLKFA